jgi:mRNA-degrading endonuclease toxin of MazEF toxin-antitoxin module
MPVGKTLGYDHPAYITPIPFFGQTTVGASGVSPKFAAFTAMQIRAVCTTPNVASTAAGSQPLLFVKSGTATATTTLTALTSAAITPLTNVLATAVTLVQGDQVWVTHGTDATAVLSVGIEMYAVPGATLAAPV